MKILILDTIGWLMPKVGFVSILFIIGFKLAGGSGRICIVVGGIGFLSFLIGYVVSGLFGVAE